MFGDEDCMIRVDMSEYSERRTSSRLTGVPPG
jgi:ATP-dependent Clp protease ATP-binding subunit ClpC